MSFQIIIPAIPPSVNHYYGHRRFRSGRQYAGKAMYLTQEARDFKTIFAAAYNKLRADSKEVPYVGGDVRVKIIFHLNNRRNFDVDNHIKIVLDSAKNLCMQDDRNVVEHLARKQYEPDLQQEYTEFHWEKA